MKTITLQDLDRWGARGRLPGERYSDERVRQLWGGDSTTPLELARMKSIPLKDRLWALLRVEVLGDAFTKVLREIAEPVVEKYALHCGIPDVEGWAQNWLSGEDRTRESVEKAARATARATVRAASAEASAAWAEVSAVWAAAVGNRAAAWAWAEASAAVGNRAAARERRRQLDIVVEALKERAA